MMEPLFLDSSMHEKIWGGSRLKTEFGYDIPSEHTGEYWAISAHPNGLSYVKNGQYAGYHLAELYADYPELFGYPKGSVFPLLTKILDANDWLSVQVHPDDHYAMEHEGELGKTECWYVIAADEGAEIIYGHRAHSREELASMIAAGDWDKLLTRVPVKSGDFFYVPSGTMHAIGKGVLILETQQSSDTTYRVYDFDRKDNSGAKRELHIEKSLDVLNIGRPRNSVPTQVKIQGFESTCLTSNEFFTVYKWVFSGSVSMQQSAPYLLCSVLVGKGTLMVDHRIYYLRKGDHFILPNDVKTWEIDGQLEIIASYPNEA
ncbi:mannose-6-phosphate isomerase, class I [Streptococcus dentiloxodontae]